MSLQTNENTIDRYTIVNVSLLLNIVTQRVIIVITVISFTYHIYTEYLKLYTWNEPRFWRTECCGHSIVTIYCTCNVIFRDKRFLFCSSAFRSKSAAPNVTVFCSPFLPQFPGMLFGHCFIFETVQLLLLELVSLLFSQSTIIIIIIIIIIITTTTTIDCCFVRVCLFL